LKLYLVTCDLLDSGDYRSLKERLRAFEAKQTLSAQWALRSTHSAADLKNILRGFLGPQDRVVITEIGGEWASRRALANLGEM
jgi:hypothetical protein